MSPSPVWDRLQARRDLIRGSAIRWGVFEEAAEIVEKMPRATGHAVRDGRLVTVELIELDDVLNLLRQQWPDGET